ncbi:MAG: tetratricopeptide repeat protein [Bacillota bacterium]
MQKVNNKYNILLISIIFVLIISEPVYMIDWQDFKRENIDSLKNELSLDEYVICNYNLAISYANLGEINNSQKTLDKIEDKVGKNGFKKIISPYIKNITYDSNNLLDLNHAAFYYLINENYSKSSSYFKKITNIDPKNIWALNYLAGNYIMLGKFNHAEKILKKVENIKSNEFTNLLYGYIYYEKGNYIKAFSKFSDTGDLIEKNIFK